MGQQAAALTLEYQQRKMQEEFAATQAEMQRQYMESHNQLQTEVQKHYTDSAQKMQSHAAQTSQQQLQVHPQQQPQHVQSLAAPSFVKVMGPPPSAASVTQCAAPMTYG